ncbi:MAG: acetate/propionate family kinase [Lacipirellulaceae bacterium]
MLVLVINCGSSSIKHRLFESGVLSELAAGSVERIGEAVGRHRLSVAGTPTIDEVLAQPTHASGVARIAAGLAASGLLGPSGAPDLVAHRVVHGGDAFQDAAVVDDAVRAALERVSSLAPLHNPANLVGIDCCAEHFPGATQVAAFDTAFHHTMPPHAYRYALPEFLYRQHGVRRYGFHGASHRSAARRAAELVGRPIESLKTVVLHLGAGASAAAVDGGRSIDTSMGMTPLAGLVMATRSGDLDPGVLLYLQRDLGYDAKRIDHLLNRESGLLGLGGAADVRDLLAAARDGDERADLALEVLCYRAAKQVGAYTVALGGLDALVFSAGIGQFSSDVRSRIAARLAVLGVELDDAKNTAAAPGASDADCTIHAAASRVAVCVIAANEEREIAREALAILPPT